MRSRKFANFNEAIEYLKERGTLIYWGRIGRQAEICLYTYTTHDGRRFSLNVYYDSGLVEIRE